MFVFDKDVNENLLPQQCFVFVINDLILNILEFLHPKILSGLCQRCDNLVTMWSKLIWLPSFHKGALFLFIHSKSVRGHCVHVFVLDNDGLKSFNENLLDSPRSTRGPCCASPALGGSYSQEDNLSYQVDDDDDCHDGDYFLMWKYENGNYRKQPNQAQWYLKGG